MADLQSNIDTVRPFIGSIQLRILTAACRGEEKDFFIAKLNELAERIRTMPQSYDTNGQGEAAIVHLHYFRGSLDFYITERDAGSPDDETPGQQSQAYGVADLGYGGEFGYISIAEIIDASVELDLYWKPRPWSEVRQREAA